MKSRLSYKLVCLWDREYVFEFDDKQHYKIAKGYYSFLINPSFTLKESISCFETFFLNKISNILRIREQAFEEEKRRKKKINHRPKRKYISVKDIYCTENPVNKEEFSDYYKGIWGLD